MFVRGQSNRPFLVRASQGRLFEELYICFLGPLPNAKRQGCLILEMLQVQNSTVSLLPH